MVRVRTRTKRLSLQPMLLTVERDDARSDVHHCPSRSFLIPARFASKTLDNGAWSRCRTGALCSTSLTDYFSPGRGKAGVAPSSFNRVFVGVLTLLARGSSATTQHQESAGLENKQPSRRLFVPEPPKRLFPHRNAKKICPGHLPEISSLVNGRRDDHLAESFGMKSLSLSDATKPSRGCSCSDASSHE